MSPTRRPTGTRRRQLEWLTNFVLVVVSLFGCSVGAGLLGFYKLHLLQFISIEFVIVPVVLLGARLTFIIGYLSHTRLRYHIVRRGCRPTQVHATFHYDI